MRDLGANGMKTGDDHVAGTEVYRGSDKHRCRFVELELGFTHMASSSGFVSDVRQRRAWKRLLCFAGALLVFALGSAAKAQPSQALLDAVDAQDPSAVLTLVDPLNPVEVCVAAYVQDWELQRIELPASTERTFERSLYESGVAELGVSLGPSLEALGACDESLSVTSPFYEAASAITSRLQALRDLSGALERGASSSEIAELLNTAELSVSWSSLRRRLTGNLSRRGRWRRIPVGVGTSLVAGGLAVLLVSVSGQAQGIARSDIRLGATGVVVGGLGAFFHAPVWSKSRLRTGGTLAGGVLWSLLSIGVGAALLATAASAQIRAFGGGLLSSGAIDAMLSIGSLALPRGTRGTRGTRSGVGCSAGYLQWARAF